MTLVNVQIAENSTYFGGRVIYDASICNGDGTLYGPKPPDVCAATLAVYRPPGFKLFITTDCVVAFNDI